LVDADPRAHPGSNRDHIKARNCEQGAQEVIDTAFGKRAFDDRHSKWVQTLAIGLGDDRLRCLACPVRSIRIGNDHKRDAGRIVGEEIGSRLETPDTGPEGGKIGILRGERQGIYPPAPSKDVDEHGAGFAEPLPFELEPPIVRGCPRDDTAWHYGEPYLAGGYHGTVFTEGLDGDATLVAHDDEWVAHESIRRLGSVRFHPNATERTHPHGNSRIADPNRKPTAQIRNACAFLYAWIEHLCCGSRVWRPYWP
jgi:hypothetical protein